MTTAVTSPLTSTFIPPQTPIANNAVVATATPAAQQTAPSALSLPGGNPIVSDVTLGALLVQQGGPAAGSNPPTAPLDLKGQDLRTTDLKVLDLRGADLSGVNLSGLDLSGLDFSGANLAGANLSAATLTNTNLANVAARGANLSQATVINSTMNGADFTNADFNGAYIGNGAADTLHTSDYNQQIAENVTNVTLDGASFEGATIQRINFNNSSAVGANFSNLTANTVMFKGSNLQSANFDHFAGGVGMGFINSDLSNAALTNMASSVGSNLFSNVNLTNTQFSGSSFNYTAIGVTNLSQANLTGMVREAKHTIFNTNLSGVDFSGFSFSQTIFDGSSAVLGNGQDSQWANASSVKGANFSGASFSGVMFSNTDLGGANFSGASFSHTYAQNDKSGALSGLAGVETGDRVSVATAVAIFGSYIAGNAPADGMEYLGFNSGRTVTRRNTSSPEVSSQDATTSPASTSKDEGSATAIQTLQAIIQELSSARNTVSDGVQPLFRTSASTASGSNQAPSASSGKAAISVNALA